MPATKAIRVSQSFSPVHIEILADIVTAAQRGAVPPISDVPEFQKLCGKIIRMRQKARDLKAAEAAEPGEAESGEG